jgi:hypothetical protein
MYAVHFEVSFEDSAFWAGFRSAPSPGGTEIGMTERGSKRPLVRRLAVIAAVVVTGFLCGSSALGVTGGVVLAVGLGAGATGAVFRGEPGTCLVRRRSQ